jgi:hypothetical protein
MHLMSPSPATCLSHLLFLDLIILIISVDEHSCLSFTFCDFYTVRLISLCRYFEFCFSSLYQIVGFNWTAPVRQTTRQFANDLHLSSATCYVITSQLAALSVFITECLLSKFSVTPSAHFRTFQSEVPQLTVAPFTISHRLAGRRLINDDSLLPNVAVELLAPLLRISEVPGSNFWIIS